MSIFSFVSGKQPHKDLTKTEIIECALKSGAWKSYDDICDYTLDRFPYMRHWKFSYLKAYMKTLERQARKMAERDQIMRHIIEGKVYFRLDIPIEKKELEKLIPLDQIKYIQKHGRTTIL